MFLDTAACLNWKLWLLKDNLDYKIKTKQTTSPDLVAKVPEESMLTVQEGILYKKKSWGFCCMTWLTVAWCLTLLLFHVWWTRVSSSLSIGATNRFWPSGWHSIQWAAATFSRTFTNSGATQLGRFYLLLFPSESMFQLNSPLHVINVLVFLFFWLSNSFCVTVAVARVVSALDVSDLV